MTTVVSKYVSTAPCMRKLSGNRFLSNTKGTEMNRMSRRTWLAVCAFLAAPALAAQNKPPAKPVDKKEAETKLEVLRHLYRLGPAPVKLQAALG